MRSGRMPTLRNSFPFKAWVRRRHRGETLTDVSLSPRTRPQSGMRAPLPLCGMISGGRRGPRSTRATRVGRNADPRQECRVNGSTHRKESRRRGPRRLSGTMATVIWNLTRELGVSFVPTKRFGKPGRRHKGPSDINPGFLPSITPSKAERLAGAILSAVRPQIGRPPTPQECFSAPRRGLNPLERSAPQHEEYEERSRLHLRTWRKLGENLAKTGHVFRRFYKVFTKVFLKLLPFFETKLAKFWTKTCRVLWPDSARNSVGD